MRAALVNLAEGVPDPSPEAITKFIERWEKSGGSEMANYQLFLTELCDEILLVPHPEPAESV